MFLKVFLLFLILQVTSFIICLDTEWQEYEKKFMEYNREELFISNTILNTEFQSNVPVSKWKTFNNGYSSIAAGITSNTKINILFTNISIYGAEPKITSKVYDLKVPLRDLQFFEEKKNGQYQLLLVVHVRDKGFDWYSLNAFSLEKVWTWSIEQPISHFIVSQWQNKSLLLASITNNMNKHSAIVYLFDIVDKEYWYFQSIKLQNDSPSMCLSSIHGQFHLSIAQPTSNSLVIYHFIDRHFIRVKELSTPQIDQVICFENGFRNFIAFNGLNAGIHEITESGLVEREIMNSNLEGLEFWMPISISTYRDETILMLQRKLNHGTHFSYDVDVVIFNGKRFEEHIDVPCSLFGDKQNSLRCLTELNSKTGILGASYIALENRLFLIVPKEDKLPSIFSVELGIKKNNHPVRNDLDSYRKLQSNLQNIIENQQKEQSVSFVQHAPIIKMANYINANYNSTLTKDIENILDEIDELTETLKANFTKGKLNTIVFNKPVEIKKNITTEKWNSQSMEVLISNLIKLDQLQTISDEKKFTNLTAEELSIEIVNNVPSQNFASIIDGKVEIFGDMFFKNYLEIANMYVADSRVNQIHLSQWLDINDFIGEKLHLEQLVSKNNFTTSLINRKKIEECIFHEYRLMSGQVFIPGNVTVHTLNGHNFEKFIEQLCVNNIECFITNLKLIGKLQVGNSMATKFLNDLKFPEEFVERKPENPLLVTGLKEFQNSIFGSSVLATNGTVNGVDFRKIFTITTDQNITGNISFDNLEFANNLDLEGSAIGTKAKTLANIGLNESIDIKSNVEFLNLEVLGEVIIEKNFNNAQYQSYLENFVSKNRNATITGSKIFSQGISIKEELHIDSGMINNISLDSFIAKNTNEVLRINTIPETIRFHHLLVNGLFNRNNLSELNRTLLKINEIQSVKTELQFEQNLLTESLLVNQLIRNTTIEVECLSIEELNAESVVVQGNSMGNIIKLDLKALEERNMNYVKNQWISQPYHFSKLNIESFTAEFINGVRTDSNFASEKLYANITDILMFRNATVDTLRIEGNVAIRRLNGKHFRKIVENHAWVKLQQNFSSIIIEGDAYFECLQIEKLANTHFNDYIASLVFKNTTDLAIKNSVVFENGLIVKKLVEAMNFNGILLDNILRITGKQVILGPIHINGNVSFQDEVIVKEMINNVQIADIVKYFTIENDTLIVNGYIIFPRVPYIRNLTIRGPINSLIDFNAIKKEFVYLNEDVYLQNDIVFQTMVHLNGNLGAVSDINGVDLSDLFSRVVWVTQETDIEGPVKFTHSLECMQHLNIIQELNTKLLCGKNIKNVIADAVSIDKGILQGPFYFDMAVAPENFYTKFLNNLDMNTIVPLKTEQTISRLNISEMKVTHDVDVGNHVNGKNLTVEKARTLLRNAEQYIASNIVFSNNVLIEDNLIAHTLNGNPTSAIVTTNTDQNLSAAYHFTSKTMVNNNFIVHGLINGINLTSWEANAISAASNKPQHLKAKLMKINNLTLRGPVNGDTKLNNVNTTQLLQEIKERENGLCEIQQEIMKDFNNLCKNVTYIYKNARNQVFRFKYFEEFQTMQLLNSIKFIKHIFHQNEHYLLINPESSCLSELWRLYPEGFVKIKTIETGRVSQMEVIPDDKDLFLVSTRQEFGSLQCNIKFSTVVWKWTDEDLEVVITLPNQELLQDSQQYRTFFGLKKAIVTEFKINPLQEVEIEAYRKWNIAEANSRFVPRGFQTGLVMSTGRKLIYLNGDLTATKEKSDLHKSITIIGNVTKRWNSIIPGQNGSEFVVIPIGAKTVQNNLQAVIRSRESQVQQNLDIIKIYSNSVSGKLFDEIFAAKPTSLQALEFKNGETLLAFIESNKFLQIYEYKGIEGFKHRSLIRAPAEKLISFELPIGEQLQPRKILGLIYRGKVTLLKAEMSGSTITVDPGCAN